MISVFENVVPQVGNYDENTQLYVSVGSRTSQVYESHYVYKLQFRFIYSFVQIILLNRLIN